MMMKSKEEVLMSLHTHHEEELGITWKSALEAMQTYADQENAELKEAAVLSADAIGLLQYEMGQLRSEIALLRSRLDECRRKQMMG